MQLGTQTGSLMNHIMSRQVVGQPEPVVGMGATILCWSDREAGTVVEVFTKGKTKYIKVQHDTAIRIDQNGMSESQEYHYSPNPHGQIEIFRIGRSGLWEAVYLSEFNRYVKCSKGLKLGVREKYYDFSF